VKLSIRLFAALRERAGCERIEVDGLREGLTLQELKRELERARPELGSLEHVAGVVGTAYAPDTRALRPGDDVSLLPPVSGGASGADEALELGVFELCRAPLDPAGAAQRVAHPSCGAIATFTGTTRATSRGERVVRLEYEAFEAMTGPEMARIFERGRALLLEGERARMLVQHRLGTVGVGEPSVVVCVASPHRDAAFRLCRFLIDELKRTLPVWKKEVTAAGHVWVGDRS
jgi:molybdopterin synthase catalytic subunit